MAKKKILNEAVMKKLALRLAHEYVWEEIREELLEEFGDECPNYENCSQSAIENYEPTHNEGYD